MRRLNQEWGRRSFACRAIVCERGRGLADKEGGWIRAIEQGKGERLSMAYPERFLAGLLRGGGHTALQTPGPPRSLFALMGMRPSDDRQCEFERQGGSRGQGRAASHGLGGLEEGDWRGDARCWARRGGRTHPSRGRGPAEWTNLTSEAWR